MLKRTPLFPIYEKYGAKVIDFGGWELPVQYAGIQSEHHAVRQQAGLFDVSHMGEVKVLGPGAIEFLQRLTTNDVSKLEDGQVQYSFMCYPHGGVVDDLIVYRFNEEEFMLVINASNVEKDIEWIDQHIGEDTEYQDVSEETALLALQGPQAERILQKAIDAPVSGLKPFYFMKDVKVAEVPAIVSRTGYTGEDGFELYVHRDDAILLWERLLTLGEEEGLVPAGLGARDTLRFEARLPLYGQELSADITPIEAGLGMFVKADKGEFIGSEALLEQKKAGALRKLVGIEMVDRGIPRSTYPIYSGNDRIGEVTTGTQSPTLKKNVGLALIDRSYAQSGTEIWVEIRGKRLKAKVVPTPFYKRSGK
ncbi:glycine cleavage system aminomethyltransferase GcvT [Paenibacillus sp. J2TS4]|uniref:glycine cleavage system aminomethyltransferase GcvT n=1 Tax=Paenibacillus sp. J2TS4 TaxID=2807194 RepID=UPI001B1214C6|nr:glycine cleavage system aminomethyltransferase GcvT [Paenibacillus sp. J2TS4]GIP32184.1 aminomethyltransferase [Paenibacillus sp. J2TS4]